MKYYKVKNLEEKNLEMKEIFESRKTNEDYIKELIVNQKGFLDIKSKYYSGNIAEGNWSQVEKEADLEKVDKEPDGLDVMFGEASYEKREKDAEYEYVFIPTYYAVRIIMSYYMKNQENAEKIYSLKNSIIGGIEFILKYIGGDYKDERIDINDFIEELLDFEGNLEDTDDFINDIIDRFNNFFDKDLILEKRIKNFNESKENWYNVDFYKEKDLLLNCVMINDYKILGHNDIKKDFKHLQKEQKEKAKEKISKTPNHPYNDYPGDSEVLKGNLKYWFSQRISKKDRLVYKKDSENRVIYIATACSHYDNAANRIKSTDSYKMLEDY